ncbi:hypothetical protein H4S06_003335 [Coemansia sp. BCRC 34490]|nr:hypothetical protein LPJ72_002238 [Coemansia sp. Benny D160-2]KAJ2508110.1 hypothetical protein GGI11_006171 [Coemansia sp. RSA 2049]KAJ2517474.1 hypothetical protein H4217_003950 [Coemansia sp. RSA 1939]KAJ2604884.1 hypothetical protein EV177_006284 [Coemansia sp. RSA 1804]KAJ2661681.1 hypothetical protein IWW48_002227 [Coemansia sp. RSA 1200]KAJ2756115.1 hypothetical protein H4S06_003335 [Coemansia sp. BCRC 34490]
MSEFKVAIKSTDMEEERQSEVTELALAAFEKHTQEKDIAAYIKRECDKKYGTTWHAVVGRSFGSFVTHETHSFIYFYVDQLAVLLFKSG